MAASLIQGVRNLSCRLVTRIFSPQQASTTSSMLQPVAPQVAQTRGHRYSYVDKHMIKDVKRRNTVKEYYPLRQRLNAVRKNVVLPREIQDMAHKEVIELPRDSNYIRVRHRCVLTSRPRGNLRRWRMCRMQWRLLADYNKLSGVTRACF